MAERVREVSNNLELDSTKVVRACFEPQPYTQFHAICLYRDNSYLNQRLAAVGCANHILVARLDTGLSELFSLSIKAGKF
jgi:hypothetical protein